MNETAESHQIDQLYSAFKPFEEWRKCPIDRERWETMRSRIEAFKGADASLLERAQRIARRAAAVESGAIEELYKTDRGITMTIASEAAGWEATINSTGEPAIIRDQLDAYEGLLDLAAQRLPFTEAGVRELHSRLCRSQETYLVQTPITHDVRIVPKQAIQLEPGYRNPLDGQQSLHLYVRNDRPPAKAEHGMHIQLMVPKNPTSGDSILLVSDPEKGGIRFEVRVDEVIPSLTTSVAVRTRTLADGIVNGMVAALAKKAAQQATKS